MTKRTIIPSLRAASLFSAVMAQIALANPVVCSPGYWDATCNPRINAGYQAAPTCSSGPGWTTVSTAQWQGSHFSSPQCNYQAPPQCPAGYSTVSGASWNGSSWVGLACAIPPPPGNVCPYGYASGPTWTGSSWAYTCNAQPSNPGPVCESAIAAQMARAGFNGTNGSYRGVWGALQGPYALGGGQVYPAGMFAGMGGSMRGGQGPGDFYYVRDLGNPSAGGATGGNGIGVCWFQSGTSNLTGYDYLEDLGSDGG